MASELSTYLANEILDWFKGANMPSAPTAAYIALFNGDPTATGTGGTEVTSTIRPAGRVAVTFGAITSRQITNSADVDFGTADAGASVTHAAIFDAATAGNLLSYTALDTPRVVTAADPVLIPIGDLRIHFN